MNDATAAHHRARFCKVLDYIDTNLDGDLSVEKLSNIAAFSKYHFHRLFSEYMGIGVHQYVQLVRMRRAAYQLAFRQYRPIIDIALANGYEGPESFARTFKQHLGQSPSQFRKQPRWSPWYATDQSLRVLRSQHMQSTITTQPVVIVNFAETRVATFEHHGDPQQLGHSIQQFIAWRKEHRLPPSVSATFNIFYNNPVDVPPTDYRLDICAATDRTIAPNQYGVIENVIPSGRCAQLRHIGSSDTINHTIRHLYLDWLPQSGETLRDFPLFCQRITFFPDVPENEAVTDIYLPIR